MLQDIYMQKKDFYMQETFICIQFDYLFLDIVIYKFGIAKALIRANSAFTLFYYYYFGSVISSVVTIVTVHYWF